MKWGLIIALIAAVLTASAHDTTPNDIRKAYLEASQDLDFRMSFLELLESSHDRSNAFNTAYLGAAKAMAAEVCYAPWTKLSYFNEGTTLLDEAISKEPNNAEYRFLRLMIQLNAPGFLDYDTEIKSDYAIVSQTVLKASKRELWMEYFSNFNRQNQRMIAAKLN